jgi:hypothetical protein
MKERDILGPRLPPLLARGSFQCLIGSCVGEGLFVGLVEVVASLC